MQAIYKIHFTGLLPEYKEEYGYIKNIAAHDAEDAIHKLKQKFKVTDNAIWSVERIMTGIED